MYSSYNWLSFFTLQNHIYLLGTSIHGYKIQTLILQTLFDHFLSMALPAHSEAWSLIHFRNHFSQRVVLTGRVISSSQGHYLNTEHKHISNIHALSGIRTHDPSVWESEDSSCLRPRGYCDRLDQISWHSILTACHKKSSQPGRFTCHKQHHMMVVHGYWQGSP
jgi:hypothetical protein